MNAGRPQHNLFLTGLWLLEVFSFINSSLQLLRVLRHGVTLPGHAVGTAGPLALLRWSLLTSRVFSLVILFSEQVTIFPHPRFTPVLSCFIGRLLLVLKCTTDLLSSTYRDTCGELLHDHHLPTSKYTMVYLSCTRTALVNIYSGIQLLSCFTRCTPRPAFSQNAQLW